MARKPVPRSLPALRTLHPEFRGLSPEQHASAAIRQLLRQTILRVRTAGAQPFYSVREVAAFFGVSPPTIATIYGRLEAEGLLVRIRGSQTLLAGRKMEPRHPVRGVVGITIPVDVFLHARETRFLYIRLEEELREQRFVADFIFYGWQDVLHHLPDFCDRLLRHELDAVWWAFPDRGVVPAMLQLQDAGIQQVTVGDGKARYPREQYVLDIWSGLVEGVAVWRQAGIERIVVVGPEHAYWGGYARELERHILEPSGLGYQVCTVTAAEAARLLQRFSRQRRVGVILSWYYWYAALCDKHPQVMERLFHSCRVLLCQGALIHGFLEGKEVFADCVTYPNDQIARRVARDIGAGKIATTKRLATFRTAFQPRVNLGKLHLNPWG